MITTFYSFKGGVGRSMALANVADRMARRGLRVLVVDFDLEAPGLERYWSIDKDAALANLGLIDLLKSFKESLAGRDASIETAAFRDLSRFVFPVYEGLGERGRLDLLTAGCRSAGDGLRRYALDVRTFDWQDFHYNWEGDAFFEWLRRELAGPTGRYDAVLVDSRTGVTEMGGVCAYQLADTVVMLSAANHQNLLGTLDVANDFRSAPVMAVRHGRPLQLLVLPARIEQRDPALLDDFYRRFDAAFEGHLPATLAGLTSRQLTIPYQPEYAFEEIVVTDPHRRDALAGVGSAFERLAHALVLLGGGAMLPLHAAARAALFPAQEAPAVAAETPLQYDPTRRFAGYDAFLSCDPKDDPEGRLAQALRARELSVFVDSSGLVPGDDVSQAATQALHHSGALVLCVGAGGLSPWQKREVEQARGALPAVRVLPVLLKGADPEILGLSLRSLADVAVCDLRGWPEREVEFEVLVGLLQRRSALDAPSAAPAVELPSANPYPGLAAAGEWHGGVLDVPATTLEALLSGLRDGCSVLLTGASGSGKTSLVNAGLMPALRAGAFGPPALETKGVDATADPRWLDALSRSGTLEIDRLHIVDAIDEDGPALPPDDPATEARRRAWLEALQRLVDRADSRRLLLLVARQSLPELRIARVAMSAPPATLPRLDVPALRTGMAFEPGLLERLDADTRPGHEPLTLGNLVLPQLWDSARRGFLTNDGYAALGGVAGAYERHAVATLARMPKGIEAAANGVLLWLLQGSAETAWTWRTSPWPRLAELRGWSDAMRRAVLWLTRERIVHLEEIEGVLELSVVGPLAPTACSPIARLLEAHGPRLRLRGALAFALERWKRAGRSDEALLTGQALTDAQGLAASWDRHLTHEMVAFVGMSEQAVASARTKAEAVLVGERVKRRRVGYVALAVLAVVIGAGATLAWRAGARHTAELQEQARRSEEELRRQASHSAAEIYEANAVAARAARAVAQVAGGGGGGGAASAAGERLRADADALRDKRIAIQYVDACERPAVVSIATALGALGASVDPPKVVKIPVGGSVRFAYPADRDAAQRLQRVLGELVASLGLGFVPALTERHGDADAVRPGTLEVWLPALSRLNAPAEAQTRPRRDNAVLKLVPGGCATLGSERADRIELMGKLGIAYFALLDNDLPQERRWIDAFYMQRTEVTNAQFASYVAEACAGDAATGACPTAWHARGVSGEPARFLPWSAADAYCRWAGGRLPTESEWEKAARGTDGRIWPWGNEPDPQRFLGKATSKQRLAAVGSFPAGDSPYGIADLAGNVWELTASPWPDGGHVMKGGSYLNDLPYVRGSSRWSSGDEDKGADYLGFRCAYSLDQGR